MNIISGCQDQLSTKEVTYKLVFQMCFISHRYTVTMVQKILFSGVVFVLLNQNVYAQQKVRKNKNLYYFHSLRSKINFCVLFAGKYRNII